MKSRSNINQFKEDYCNQLLYGKPIDSYQTPIQLNDHLEDGDNVVSFFSNDVYQQKFNVNHRKIFKHKLDKLAVKDPLQFIYKRGDVTTALFFCLSKNSLPKHELLQNIFLFKHFINYFTFQNQELIGRLNDDPLILPWRKTNKSK